MRFKPLHPDFILPIESTEVAGAFDIHMTEAGAISNQQGKAINLGFSAEVPPGCIALVTVKPSIGTKYGVELNSTVGMFGSNYEGEWKVSLKTKAGTYRWEADDSVLQFVIVPLFRVKVEEVY